MRHIPAAVIVLLLIPGYIVGVSMLPDTVRSTCEPTRPQAGATDQVGFCEEIGLAVQRQYYFGLLTLPVYKAGVSLDRANKTFLPFLLAATLAILWHRHKTTNGAERPQHWNDRNTVTPD